MPKLKKLLQAAIRLASQRLPVPLRAWIGEIRDARRVSRSPDRALLLTVLLPALLNPAIVPSGANVLWIGCRRYTRPYYRLIEQYGVRCWSVDLDPEVAHWGRRSRHLTGDMLALARLFPRDYFDTVFCNGVLGYGVDSPAQQLKGFESIAAVTRPGGWLLVGWNTDRTPDLFDRTPADGYFEHIPLPAALSARLHVHGTTHVYDTYRRLHGSRTDVAPAFERAHQTKIEEGEPDVGRS